MLIQKQIILLEEQTRKLQVNKPKKVQTQHLSWRKMTSAALLIVQKRHTGRVKNRHNHLLPRWLQSRTAAPAATVVTNAQKQDVDQQHPEPPSQLQARWAGEQNCFGCHMRHGDRGLGPAARRACRPHLCTTRCFCRCEQGLPHAPLPGPDQNIPREGRGRAGFRPSDRKRTSNPPA